MQNLPPALPGVFRYEVMASKGRPGAEMGRQRPGAAAPLDVRYRMMKAKKWMALALAVVMAVGMLAGCGSGTSSSNRSAMSVSKVNSALRAAESKTKAKTVDGLNEAVEKAADYMVKRGTLDANTLLGFIASERGYDNNNKYGAVFVVSEEELEAGISPSRAAEGIASQVKLEADTSKVEKVGVLDSPERVAAAVILSVDESLKQWSNIPFVNIENITYAVSGRKVTLVNDVVYYLIVVEMSTSDD